jgi:predicted methyltransferase
MRAKWVLSALAVLTLAAAGAVRAAPPPSDFAAAISDKGRPVADTSRDAARKPADMLAFAGVEPGFIVVDFLPGGGYFTRLFSKAVGPKGVVYALYPPPKPSTDPAKPAPPPAAATIAADPAYANVKPVQEPLGTVELPVKVDVFWTSQNYHDLHNVPGLDMLAFNKAVFAALKPGGVYIVLDHVGPPGDPQVTHTLHRIDPAVVRKEVEAAGFKYVGESVVLHNPADTHSLNVHDPAIRGRTDQFVFKFVRPA